MIKLGMFGKDNVTGFSGLVISRIEHLHGCSHICLSPKEIKDGVPVKDCCFDEQRIDIIKEKYKLIKEYNPTFPLGSEVKDSITGYSGIAVCHEQYLFGIGKVAIQKTTLDEGGKYPLAIWFDEPRVVIIRKDTPKVSQSAEKVNPGSCDVGPSRVFSR